MYLLYKDHKKTELGDILKSRPVISSSSGMGIHLNNILSEYIEAIGDNIEGRIEVISGEELLNRVDRLNKLIEMQEKRGDDKTDTDVLVKLRDLVLTGSDAVALYPSMKREATALSIREEAMSTTVNWKGINYKECSRYVAIHYEPWEVRRMGLKRVVPWRRYNKGTKPGVKGKEVMGKEVDDEEKWELLLNILRKRKST